MVNTTALLGIYLTFLFGSAKPEQGGHEPFCNTCPETWGYPHVAITKDNPDTACVN